MSKNLVMDFKKLFVGYIFREGSCCHNLLIEKPLSVIVRDRTLLDHFSHLQFHYKFRNDMYQKSSMKQFYVPLWKLNWFMIFKLVPDTSYTSTGIIYCCWCIALFFPISWGTFLFWCICEIPRASPAFAFHWSSAWLESPWMLLCLNLNWFCSWNPAAIFSLAIVSPSRDSVWFFVLWLLRLGLCDSTHLWRMAFGFTIIWGLEMIKLIEAVQC